MGAPIVIFSRLRARSGARDALVDVLRDLAAAAAVEPGTEQFDLFLARDDADAVWIFERFTDEAARDAHRDAPGTQDVATRLGELLAEPPTITYVTAAG